MHTYHGHITLRLNMITDHEGFLQDLLSFKLTSSQIVQVQRYQFENGT
jgi:hypothetical protein